MNDDSHMLIIAQHADKDMIRVIRTRQSQFIAQWRYNSAAPAPDVWPSRFLSTAASQPVFRCCSKTTRIHRHINGVRLFSAKTDTSSNKSDLPRFQQLEQLSPDTLTALQRAGLEQLTEIQAKTFDPILSGKDVIARARTGTGKVGRGSAAGLEGIVLPAFFFDCAYTYLFLPASSDPCVFDPCH